MSALLYECWFFVGWGRGWVQVGRVVVLKVEFDKLRDEVAVSVE